MWCFSEPFSTQENFDRKRLCDSQIRRNKLGSRVANCNLFQIRICIICHICSFLLCYHYTRSINSDLFPVLATYILCKLLCRCVWSLPLFLNCKLFQKNPNRSPKRVINYLKHTLEIKSTKYSTHKVQKHWENRARDNSICGLQKVLMEHYVTCVLSKYVHKASVLKTIFCIYLELCFSSCTLSLVLSTLHSSFSKF